MKGTKTSTIAKVTVAAIAGLLLTFQLHAEIRSKSHDLVIVQPQNLPEQAQIPGNSLFLYQDNSGDTYLYVEQAQGAKLTAFDVTDPSKVRLISTTALDVPGGYDFVRPIDGHAEMIRFWNHKGVAVLDLRKVRTPVLKVSNTLNESGLAEPLGETGLLMVVEHQNNPTVAPHDLQVVDVAAPSTPILLATVKQVEHKVVNGDTGTTFLLGSEGLTIIRRPSVENDYRTHLMQMNQN